MQYKNKKIQSMIHSHNYFTISIETHLDGWYQDIRIADRFAPQHWLDLADKHDDGIYFILDGMLIKHTSPTSVLEWK